MTANNQDFTLACDAPTVPVPVMGVGSTALSGIAWGLTQFPKEQKPALFEFCFKAGVRVAAAKYPSVRAKLAEVCRPKSKLGNPYGKKSQKNNTQATLRLPDL